MCSLRSVDILTWYSDVWFYMLHMVFDMGCILQNSHPGSSILVSMKKQWGGGQKYLNVS